MKPITKKAQAVFDKLVAGLEVGGSRKFDNWSGVFMPLHVERLGERFYSLAHYYESCGDLVSDPDGEFWVDDAGRAHLVALTQGPVGVYTRAVEFEDGEPARFRPRACRDLAGFAGMWLGNVKAQQGL